MFVPVADMPAPRAAAVVERLRVAEIFHSIQGEADAVGWRTVFVRLVGCPLRCAWCDTPYAFHGGSWWSSEEILAEVKRHDVRHVCVTGGEPLAQKRCLNLMKRLCELDYKVSLETSGALDLSGVDVRVRKVMDLKAPDSGECARNRWSNIDHLLPHDQIKIVIASRADYDWACAAVAAHALDERCMVVFSPAWQQMPPQELAEWIMAAKLPVRFQLQLHKVLWQEAPGR